ncbi:hypothetical protein CF70_029430 [Cupriavidus sp. SK-3]|uniref:hypothetical protein n=1 Tax=Cupriavidus sp. SK-3 TaxID=1470558 RepID=UPI00045375AC|nr:hypothetical protein [Cupriavidus sp. SK-3]KDP88626.1 hypothetical protein CF70_029430 [Cupriavidus sp. SK-3]
MEHQRGRIFFFPSLLILTAIALLVGSVSRDGFWRGAIVVVLLWWAYNDWKLRLEKERDQRLVAENAPELIGKNFGEAAAYTLGALDKFMATASPFAQRLFADALLKQQAEWSRQGQPMPIWATLRLLRQVESHVASAHQ